MTATITRRAVVSGAAATAVALTTGSPANALAHTHTVRIQSFAFVPARIEVRVGDTIKWINEDLAPHTATANEFGWDTGEITQNQTSEITVSADMETAYFCVFHPHMKGELVFV